MKTIAIYTITSSLHDQEAVGGISDVFLRGIFPDGGYELIGQDFSHYGDHPLSLIYIRTGGAEGIFKAVLPDILKAHAGKIYLLTSGKSNSLAASIEILSYLRQKGIAGEILHGKDELLRTRIAQLSRVAEAKAALRDSRIGLVGKPSDWLIASEADRSAIKEKLGADFADIPMQELIELVQSLPEENAPAEWPMKTDVRSSLPGAKKIYKALEIIKDRYGLSALTVRCFDLLTSVHNTGCIALAGFNALGIPASCEGDVPALLTMMLSQALTGCTGFQANPSRIDMESGELLFAHCTIPLNIPRNIQYDTHFESGIGVGLHGEFPEGPVTIAKLSGDLSRAFLADGQLLRNQYEDNLCRTQVIVKVSPEEAGYFLTNPIGNHHIIIPGHHKALFREFLALWI